MHRRPGTALPIELELSLGMRKYAVLLTDDNDKQTEYRPDIGHYVLSDQRVDGDQSI